jgi:hypothetical protein
VTFLPITHPLFFQTAAIFEDQTPRFSKIKLFTFQPTAAISEDQLPRFSLDKNKRAD